MALILHPNLTSHLVETLLQLAASDGLQCCHIYISCILSKWKDAKLGEVCSYRYIDIIDGKTIFGTDKYIDVSLIL
jgi:hypothetical protein